MLPRTIQIACAMTLTATAALAAEWVSVGTTKSGAAEIYWDRQATKASGSNSAATTMRDLFKSAQRTTTGISWNEQLVDVTVDCRNWTSTLRNRRLLLNGKLQKRDTQTYPMTAPPQFNDGWGLAFKMFCAHVKR